MAGAAAAGDRRRTGITESLDSYVEIAVALRPDRELLARYRSVFTETNWAATIGDIATFTFHYEECTDPDRTGVANRPIEIEAAAVEGTDPDGIARDVTDRPGGEPDPSETGRAGAVRRRPPDPRCPIAHSRMAPPPTQKPWSPASSCVDPSRRLADAGGGLPAYVATSRRGGLTPLMALAVHRTRRPAPKTSTPQWAGSMDWRAPSARHGAADRRRRNLVRDLRSAGRPSAISWAACMAGTDGGRTRAAADRRDTGTTAQRGLNPSRHPPKQRLPQSAQPPGHPRRRMGRPTRDASTRCVRDRLQRAVPSLRPR